MQPNNDLRDDDARLHELLREWRAPETPQSLEAAVLESRTPWWKFLVTGSIRVPVPVVYFVTALVLLAGWQLVKPAHPAPCVVAEQPAVCSSALPGAC